ncbi:MAG: polysaccharide ABC transporter ATP-binding protein [Paludibacter sp.]|nr:polysaccharide ABC transporter ATP-binding protein [Paludibacter sp.]
MSTSIKFENISKQYRLGLVSTKTLSHDLNRWWTTNIRGKEDPYLKIGEVNDRAHKGESDYVWALKDIDFKVEQGDVLGIIGKNGAGKSTLLKILSKVTTPTTGTIKAAGRIASLLEVGTGFHPEMTGRENIFMNGAIMGMTKREIASKLDEIVDFSGVERYLDTPAKRYSSGMTVRLGFAIAAHLEPEILVVDEVLAVGDAEFQKKAIGKMQDVSKGEGRTVLFVSHNMGSISMLCNKGIILSKGELSFTGKIEECVSKYITEGSRESVWVGSNFKNDIYYKSVSILNNANQIIDSIAFDDSVRLKFELGYNRNILNATLSFTLFDSKLNAIFTSHHLLKYDEVSVTAVLPKEFLLPGNYFIKPILHVPNLRFIDNCETLLAFRIEDTGSEHSFYNRPELGVLNINPVWIN